MATQNALAFNESDIERANVAADHSCLFTSAAYLCQGLTDELELKTAGRKLREVCAEAVLADALIRNMSRPAQQPSGVVDDVEGKHVPTGVMLRATVIHELKSTPSPALFGTTTGIIGAAWKATPSRRSAPTIVDTALAGTLTTASILPGRGSGQ